MLYAKSEPLETIKEHTEELLNRLKMLKEIYGEEIIKDVELQNRFWELLKIICKYHDIGKAYTPFQNLILDKIEKKQIATKFNYKEIKHEQLSPLFIPMKEYEMSKEEIKIIVQAIFYHHERNSMDIDRDLVQEIIKDDIMSRINYIEEELETKLNKCPNNFYLGYVGESKRIIYEDGSYRMYCLLKGLLHRLDHSASAHVEIEDVTKEEVSQYVTRFMEEKGYNLNELQKFCINNQNNNIVVIGSTGMGKTEAALLWSKGNKTFFTLPIRISINDIFDRIRDLIGYHHVGLLHSTSLDYLETKGKEEIESSYLTYEQSKNLASKITTCTIDQIFKFVFKYRGYEKIYATLAYSKVIIDEIQGYSPEIVAVILKGMKMINDIGGRFMIMTATLPKIYIEELEKFGVKFEYNEFLKKTKRHRIKIEAKEIIEDVSRIYEIGKEKKVLVIVNTINKAIELYKEVKKQGKMQIKMLHSRFIIKDRIKREKEIKEFSQSNKTGIWITTQIVEASLDIDFDCLFTEMSTLDSLFQRLGRCYRSRELNNSDPNVYIYNKNSSGIKSVYDEDIHKKSIELLEKYDGIILEEKDKVKLVDKIYSKEYLKGTEFLKKFEEGMTFLNNLVDYDTDKAQAQKLLRNINNIKVIPRIIYDENMELFKRYNCSKNNEEKRKIKREIERFTTNISSKQAKRLNEFIWKSEIEDIMCIDFKYDENIGLLLQKDEEYELNSRFI